MFPRVSLLILAFALGVAARAGEEPDRVDIIKNPAQIKNNEALAELDNLRVPTLLSLNKLSPETRASLTSWFYPTLYLSLAPDNKSVKTSAGEIEGYSLAPSEGRQKLQTFKVTTAFNNILKNAQVSRYQIDRAEFSQWKELLGERKLFYAAEDLDGDENSPRLKTEVSPEHYFKALKMQQQAEAAREVLATHDVDRTQLTNALEKFYRSSIDLSAPYMQYAKMIDELRRLGPVNLAVGEKISHSRETTNESPRFQNK